MKSDVRMPIPPLLGIVGLFITFFYCEPAFSQKEAALLPYAETDHYKIESLDLPGSQEANNVNCIVQGPNGFLWIGSHDGLHRYDGHQVLSYPEAAIDSLETATRLDFPYVENLYWDRFNKLWVCTYGGGLYQFDPTTEQFKHFGHDPEDPASISNDWVMCAAEDADGDLWFGTEKGLNRFDRDSEKFERFLPDSTRNNSLSHEHVRNIFLDRQGSLWIGTGVVHWQPHLGGLNRYEPESNSFITFIHDPADSTSLWTNAVQGLLEDRRGNFWIASTPGLQKLDRNSGRFERMPYRPNYPYAPGANDRENPSAWSLLEDQEGGLWVGTIGDYDYPSHLLRYDPSTRSVETLPVHSAAWHLFESRDGSIWVSEAGEGGGNVLKITRKQRSYDLLRGTQLFRDFKQTTIFRELSQGDPADRLVGPLSLAFSPQDGSMWLAYILEVQDGDRFTPYPILAHHDPKAIETRFHHLQELKLDYDQPVESSSYVYRAVGMAVEKSGKVWGTFLSDQVGVYCFDPQTEQTKNFVHHPNDSNSLLSNEVIFVMMDSNGKVWAAQNEKGLSCLDPQSAIWTHYTPDGKASRRIGGFNAMAVMEAKDGRIWTGGLTITNESFLTAIDPETETTQHYPVPKNVPVFNYPRFFAQSGENIYFSLFVNGLGGLILDSVNNNLVHYFPDKNNFPLHGVASVVADQEGHLWVASRFDDQFVRLDIDSKRWIPFSNHSGEPALDRVGALGPQGKIYFVQPGKGWTEIDPAYLPEPEKDVSLLKLTDLYLNKERQVPGKSEFLGSPIWELEQLELPQEDLPFSLEFSSFHYRSPEVKIHYRLFPYQNDWQVLHGEYRLDYSNLPVGTYQLQVKAYPMNGLADREIDLQIVITPPWWKTWWAYLLYGLGLFLLLRGFYLYQRRRWQLQTELQLEHERADRLRELDQFKSRFYTNITHEFRTPLTVIKGMAEQIKGDEKTKDLIQRNSDRLLVMVNQLLELSKLETNTLTIKWVNGDVLVYLQYLTESCHSLAGNKKINLAFFSPEESLKMDFDEELLQQILINLISNAIKFTPEYGSVKVLADKVSEQDKPHLLLTVKDTGQGIPPEEIPFIFDRFYRAPMAQKNNQEGVGIGLALVKELVQVLGGRIDLSSELDKGSAFMVYLPIRNEAPVVKSEVWKKTLIPILERTPARDTDQLSEVRHSDDKPLVLVIEDNADVIDYIFSCLSGNYSLLSARNGKLGMEQALASIPDVIISDVMMPEMDGFEVCRFLKSDRRTSHIPIILLTAKATQEDKLLGLTEGADAYLTKPFDREELLVRLQNLSQLSKRMQERLSITEEIETTLNASERREAAFLAEVNEIIHENLGDSNFKTPHLCRSIAMSRAQLHRKLKALTGRSTGQYIRRLRLKRAMDLLENTDLLIGEIALEVGYTDASHFSRSFLKAFGKQPSEIRK